uniref:Uncharacterized protein n=1 Tax=Arundo donax TaxID=35708 RepID=A0A0A9DEJ9_ARUDO
MFPNYFFKLLLVKAVKVRQNLVQNVIYLWAEGVTILHLKFSTCTQKRNSYDLPNSMSCGLKAA